MEPANFTDPGDGMSPYQEQIMIKIAELNRFYDFLESEITNLELQQSDISDKIESLEEDFKRNGPAKDYD